MQGAIEALLSGLVFRGLGPAVSGILMAAPLKKVARAQLKKIYVLDERGEMAGEYVLDSDCPIDYNDFLKVLPDEGIGDRDSLFVGEYVFTAFQSGKFAFVLLSRGQLAPDDVNWTARVSKEYFAKLSANRYARFSIRFYPGSRNFIVLESFINPVPERRNLEFNGTFR